MRICLSTNSLPKLIVLAASDAVHLKLLVPSIAAGSIIGRGGEAIAQVQKDSGAKVCHRSAPTPVSTQTVRSSPITVFQPPRAQLYSRVAAGDRSGAGARGRCRRLRLSQLTQLPSASPIRRSMLALCLNIALRLTVMTDELLIADC